ncbi:hypothetical protein ALC62_03208 [Cyphomyrmex costatus]|uniref:Glycoprotein n=1 Tax=Cyphomyrmex costatus TaxID=456900 RepID=A0A151ILT9_9HYME|nr:hypothetical protein ALC62_03208 [Cyphomyrmex costatus]
MDPRIKGITTIFIITIWIQQAYGIIGYDCSSASANLTTLSLINIEECDIPLRTVNSSRVYVQLLQLDDFKSVSVIQCKIEIERTIKKCGMFSHTMDVHNGQFSYITEVSRDACQRMHTYGSFEIAGTHITGLKSNQTASRPITLAGQVDHDGTCAGSAYSDPYGTWSHVIVLGSIKITLQDYVADVKINTNRVHLRSGVTCELSATHCTDIEGGDTFWKPVPEDSCKLSDYSSLYNGYADKIFDAADKRTQTVYSLNAQSLIFSLASTGEYTTCGHKLTRTEHPKLIIFETSPPSIPGTEVFKSHGFIAMHIDLFTYINSKFVYVERHIRTQINQLYKNVLLQQCQIEYGMMQNSLAIATGSPDVFAYHFMKGPGYMALLAGEVIHVVKCVPVEVRIARTTECYEQLPVLRGNDTYFLTPQTHILIRHGTQVTCNSFAPSMYQLGDSWYKIMPKPVETIPPTVMKPSTKPSWKYISPGALATSGIYSQSDLEELKDHIMFPAERPAILNTVARGILGQTTVLNGGSLSNLIDEASIERIAASAWTKFWNKFLIFGNVSAGLIGIYLTARLIKLLLDTFVHGYALHTVYGWSVYLFGAVWDSLTQLLLHLGKNNPKNVRPSAPDLELQEYNEAIPPETLALMENSTKLEPVYPQLPPQENSTYTLQLKG